MRASLGTASSEGARVFRRSEDYTVRGREGVDEARELEIG